jgi:hypothetical protein
MHEPTVSPPSDQVAARDPGRFTASRRPGTRTRFHHSEPTAVWDRLVEWFITVGQGRDEGRTGARLDPRVALGRHAGAGGPPYALPTASSSAYRSPTAPTDSSNSPQALREVRTVAYGNSTSAASGQEVPAVAGVVQPDPQPGVRRSRRRAPGVRSAGAAPGGLSTMERQPLRGHGVAAFMPGFCALRCTTTDSPCRHRPNHKPPTSPTGCAEMLSEDVTGRDDHIRVLPTVLGADRCRDAAAVFPRRDRTTAATRAIARPQHRGIRTSTPLQRTVACDDEC